MPNTRTAAKRVRADRARRERNLRFSSELKTLTKQFHASLQAKQAPHTQDLLRQLMKKLDMASQKGIIHRKTASRQKARLSRRLAHAAA